MGAQETYVVWDPRLKVVNAKSRQEALLVAHEQFKQDPPSTGDLLTETLDDLTVGPVPDLDLEDAE